MTDPLANTYSNWVSIAAKAAPALANNVAYLAVVSPTQAQAVAQVQALTRQVNAIIRVLLGVLDSQDGT